MASKDIARLDARIDGLSEQLDSMTTRLDTHIDRWQLHERNHHGRASTARKGGMIGVIAAALAVAIEVGWQLLQRFL